MSDFEDRKKRMSSLPRRVAGSINRRTTATMTPRINRSISSSQFSRAMSSQIARSISRSSSFGVASKPKNTNPRFNTKEFQQTTAGQIVEFFNTAKMPDGVTFASFSGRGSNSLSVKELNKCQSRLVDDMFSYLFLFFRPGYVMKKSREEEVIENLNLINYPYTITKSHLKTINTHTFPFILPIFHWVINLIIVSELCVFDGEVRRDLFSCEDDFIDDVRSKSAEICKRELATHLESLYKQWISGDRIDWVVEFLDNESQESQESQQQLSESQQARVDSYCEHLLTAVHAECERCGIALPSGPQSQQPAAGGFHSAAEVRASLERLRHELAELCARQSCVRQDNGAIEEHTRQLCAQRHEMEVRCEQMRALTASKQQALADCEGLCARLRLTVEEQTVSVEEAKLIRHEMNILATRLAEIEHQIQSTEAEISKNTMDAISTRHLLQQRVAQFATKLVQLAHRCQFEAEVPEQPVTCAGEAADARQRLQALKATSRRLQMFLHTECARARDTHQYMEMKLAHGQRALEAERGRLAESVAQLAEVRDLALDEEVALAAEIRALDDQLHRINEQIRDTQLKTIELNADDLKQSFLKMNDEFCKRIKDRNEYIRTRRHEAVDMLSLAFSYKGRCLQSFQAFKQKCLQQRQQFEIERAEFQERGDEILRQIKDRMESAVEQAKK